jgi:S-phase kinase-associated protein 1
MQTITLESNDHVEFTLDVKAAQKSSTIKDMLDDLAEAESTETPRIPLSSPESTSANVKLFVEWAEHHKDDPVLSEEEEKSKYKGNTELSQWDRDFMNRMAGVDLATLKSDVNAMSSMQKIFDFLLLVNYLAATPAVHLCCKVVANVIKGKTPEEIRTLFGIPAAAAPATTSTTTATAATKA